VAKVDPFPPAQPGPSRGDAANFLHDLANLLTAISGSLELILSRPHDDRQERWARNALEAAEQAAHLAAKHHFVPFERRDEEEIAPLPPATMPPITATASAHGRILIVDDEGSVRRYVSDLLVSVGYETMEAEGGAAALAAIEQGLPDLFIVDFTMPGMTGAEFALRLLARAPEARILFMTGHRDTTPMGAVDPDIPILRKPFRSSELASAVRDALQA
jgi:CheY-like chemotaxis protein